MRIVVISDSHRRGSVVDKILLQQPEARHVFFLGDVTGDIEDLQYLYPEKNFHIVAGNCDFSSVYPSADQVCVDGVDVFYTHGHHYGVGYGTEQLCAAAKSRGCTVALYGHTHHASAVYEDGVWLVNPGSCAEPRSGGPSYAVIDLLPGGILPAIIHV